MLSRCPLCCMFAILLTLCALRAADPPKPPVQMTALMDGDVAFRQHAGGHTTGPNWPTFLAFAERYFKEMGKQ
jgi:hypothetical protein